MAESPVQKFFEQRFKDVVRKDFEKMTPKDFLDHLTNQLYKVDFNDDILSELKLTTWQDLQYCKLAIEVFKEKNPESVEIKVLEGMYKDLLADFSEGKKVEIDDSYDESESLIKEEIERANLSRTPDGVFASQDVVRELDRLGVDHEYVVELPGNKKTIVLFLQIHPFFPEELRDDEDIQLLEEKVGVHASQDNIEGSLEKMIDNGLTKTVYTEGIPKGKEPQYKDGRGLATHRIMQGYVGVEVVGYENIGMHTAAGSYVSVVKRVFGGGGDDSGNEAAMRARGTVNNWFIGLNIADMEDGRKGNVAAMVIGAAHEKGDGETGGMKDPIKMSEVLAVLGYNAVVVDESKMWSEEGSKVAFKGFRDRSLKR